MNKVSAEFDGLRRTLEALPAKVAQRAIVRALNRTLEAGKVEMARAISREYVIPVSDAKARLRVTRARIEPGGALRVEASLEATRDGKGRSMNVIAFAERKVTLAEARRRIKAGTQRELRFKFRRQGGTKTLKGAFIGNKGRTVFRRTGRQRLPIEAVNTIGIPSMFNARKLNDVVRRSMQSKFRTNFDREVRYFLAQEAAR